MGLPVSLEDMVACVDRELAMRSKVYPRWVKANPPKMTPRTMEAEMARMRAVRVTLMRAEAQALLLSQLVEADVITRQKVETGLEAMMVDVRLRFPVLP